MKIKLLLFAITLGFLSKSRAASIIASNPTPCANSPVTYTIQPGYGESRYQFSVTGGSSVSNGYTNGLPSVTVVWPSFGSGTVTLMYYSNAYPQFARLFVSVSTPNISISTSSGGAFCINSTAYYSANQGFQNYYWTVNDPNDVITQDGTQRASILWNSSGSKTITVTAKSNCGMVSAQTNVIVYAQNTPTLTGQTSYCWPQSTITYTTDVGKSNYLWSVLGGGKIISGGGVGDYSVTVTWNAYMSDQIGQTISVGYNDPSTGGCPSKNTTSALVRATNPIVTLSVPYTQLDPQGNPVPISIQTPVSGIMFTAKSFANGTGHWSWSQPNGFVILSPLSNDGPSSTISTEFDNPGSFKLSVTYSMNGCSSTASTSVFATTYSGGRTGGGGGAIVASDGLGEVGNFSVYPNPVNGSNGLVSVNIPNFVPNGTPIHILDVNGRAVFEGEKLFDETVKEIDLSSLVEGLYFMRINLSKEPLVQKILVKR